MKIKFFKNLFSKKDKENKLYEDELKRLNPGTNIFPINKVPLELVSFGKYSYGHPLIHFYGKKNSKLKVGNFVSIADEVKFLLNEEHQIYSLSTFPFNTFIFKKEEKNYGKGDIIVEDDVWIGYGVTILSGVTIGKGVIVSAGAVVTKDLEPYGIYGGVPAKLIKYRFSKEIREKLLEIDLLRINFKNFDKCSEILYEDIDLELIETIKKNRRI